MIALVIALVGAVMSFVTSGMLPPELYGRGAFDVWFEADLPRIYEIMTSRYAPTRSSLHPLFPILTYAPTIVLERLGLEPLEAIRVVLALVCGAWSAFLFVLLRMIGCRRFDACLFVAVALASSTTVFFVGTPETFIFGSLAIVLALTWAAYDASGQRSALASAFVSAATFGITVTNWMFGVVSSFVRHPWRRAVQITVNAFAIVVATWAAQKYVFPNSDFFLGLTYAKERSDHLFSPESGGVLKVLAAFFSHSMVIPEIYVVQRPSTGAWPILLAQPAEWLSSGVFGNAAVVLWLALFGLGAWAASSKYLRTRFCVIVGLTLAGQLALHVAFGNETFLYAFHWLPLLVTVAAFATLTPLRRFVLVGAAAFTVIGGVHNVRQFVAVQRFVEEQRVLVSERLRTEDVLEEQDRAPLEASPVTAMEFRDYDAAAFDARGGLWPAADTFHIGFSPHPQLLPGPEAQGNARQSASASGAAVIEAALPAYTIRWEAIAPRHWLGRLKVTGGAPVYLSMRGLGWGNSRIYSIEASQDVLTVNGRWEIRFSRVGGDVWLGTEQRLGQGDTLDAVDSVSDPNGWGVARIGPLRGGEIVLEVVDRERTGSVDKMIGTILYDYSADGVKG